MPYTHGGDIYGDAAVELDFSVNTIVLECRRLSVML